MIRTMPTTVNVTVFSIWAKRNAADRMKAYFVTVDAALKDQDALEKVYEAANLGPAARDAGCPSLSVGDMLCHKGQFYMVEGCGFQAITEAEFDKAKQFTSRELGAGYKFAAKNDWI